jgi:hypothetical protein
VSRASTPRSKATNTSRADRRTAPPRRFCSSAAREASARRPARRPGRRRRPPGPAHAPHHHRPRAVARRRPRSAAWRDGPPRGPQGFRSTASSWTLRRPSAGGFAPRRAGLEDHRHSRDLARRRRRRHGCCGCRCLASTRWRRSSRSGGSSSRAVRSGRRRHRPDGPYAAAAGDARHPRARRRRCSMRCRPSTGRSSRRCAAAGWRPMRATRSCETSCMPPRRCRRSCATRAGRRPGGYRCPSRWWSARRGRPRGLRTAGSRPRRSWSTGSPLPPPRACRRCDARRRVEAAAAADAGAGRSGRAAAGRPGARRRAALLAALERIGRELSRPYPGGGAPGRDVVRRVNPGAPNRCPRTSSRRRRASCSSAARAVWARPPARPPPRWRSRPAPRPARDAGLYRPGPLDRRRLRLRPG